MDDPRYTIDEIGLRLLQGSFRLRLLDAMHDVVAANVTTEGERVDVDADAIAEGLLGAVFGHLIDTRHLPTPENIEAVRETREGREGALFDSVEDVLERDDLRRLLGED